MRIHESTANIESDWFRQKNNSVNGAAKHNEKMIVEMNGTKEEEKTLKEAHDFRALCKEFPNVSFVVVDEIGELQPEYKGIRNTSAFGDFGQVSIMIEEKVIENLDQDWDDAVTMIQGISDHYDEIVGHVKASSACNYTMVKIHYASAENCLGVGNLSYTQMLCFDPPEYYREFGDDVALGGYLDVKEKYLQAFLMKIQIDVFDKLFEIGEDKREYKTKTAFEVVKKYQDHFAYEGELGGMYM